VVTRVGLVTIDRNRTGNAHRPAGPLGDLHAPNGPTPERLLKVPGEACRPIRLSSDLKVYKLHDFNRMSSRREHEPRFRWNPHDFET
jgi:hypothetical protein